MFLRRPFGLKNARATFQTAMDVMLDSLRWQFTLVYAVNIVVFSKLAANYIEQVRRVLRLLYEAGVTPKLKKCRLFAENMDYIGRVIRLTRLELAEHTTDALAKL